MKRNFSARLRYTMAGAAFVAATWGGQQAFAAVQFTSATTLDHLLISGNTLLVGDKVFSNFTYTPTGLDMPLASNVGITPKIITVNGIQETGFNMAGAFQDTGTAGASDVVFTYTVTVLNPGVALITDAMIIGSPLVVGSGHVIVSETFTPKFQTQMLKVFDIQPGGPSQFTDTLDFPFPTDSVDVTKDILASVLGGFRPGVASITSIDQLFSQTPGGGSGVPEPASLGMLGIGALGMLIRSRRRAGR